VGIIVPLFTDKQDDASEPTPDQKLIASMERVAEADAALIKVYEDAFEDLRRLADRWRSLGQTLDQDDTQPYIHCASVLGQFLPPRAR
jgi:hypothetical protein